ncbi:hypothetical protein AGR3A_Cc260241 [Agrobacterium tomkonis CFBP 6623]|uniref:Uncharacterized protein n=1 Tax=Agrobacterium tomkonis CFBP 6623 TaxID=1183432 RepID=A0A1S7PLR2_9HYPH|nr:hypothetical protein AGR3A_Cc260241 [Agrobacterium tomkonis CFBP 6623]
MRWLITPLPRMDPRSHNDGQSLLLIGLRASHHSMTKQQLPPTLTPKAFCSRQCGEYGW